MIAIMKVNVIIDSIVIIHMIELNESISTDSSIPNTHLYTVSSLVKVHTLLY